MYCRYSESLPAIHVNAGLIYLQHKIESNRDAQSKMALSSSRQQFLACESREGDQCTRRSGCYFSKSICCLLVACAVLAVILTAAVVFCLLRYEDTLFQKKNIWSDTDPVLASAPVSENLRLSNAVVPSFYRLKLTPRIEDSTFKGEVYITLRANEENVDKITLHSKGLNVDDKVTITEQVYERLHTIENGVRTKRQINSDITETNATAATLAPTDSTSSTPTNSTAASTPIPTQTTAEEAAKTTEGSVTDVLKDEPEYLTPTNEQDGSHNTQVTHSNTRNIRVTSVQKAFSDRLVLNLETPLKPGTDYTLEISFSGNITNSLTGFYKSTYDDNDKQTKEIAVTQFEPIYARTAFPCFDEPQFKAMFEISIAHRDHMTALSNMPVASREPVTDTPGWMWTHFTRSVKMSTYIVAYAIVDFKYLETSYLSKDNVTKPIRVWAQPSLIDNAQYAIKIVPKLLEFYEELFGLPYALNKMDLIAVPDFSSGAMENWGLITFRETTLLYDEKANVVRDKQSVAIDVAHELAHQWFGNLVTMSWWTDLWLNEGFATYVEYIGVDHIAPEWNMMDAFTRSKMELLRSDALKHTTPVSSVVVDASEILQKFDEISYLKGASVIRMLNHTISERLFHKGLVAYLKKWKYSNAEEDDLWASMSEAIKEEPNQRNISVVQFMDTWTKQAGYPVVTALRNYNTSSVVFKQNIFTTMTAPPQSTLDRIWSIPISYTSMDTTLSAWDTAPKLWLNQREKTVSCPLDSTQALYVNVNSIGYYRVNYDRENWQMLNKALNNKGETIPPLVRAQLLDDAFNLAKVSELPYSTALNLTTYLMNGEDSRIVWELVLSNLAFLKFTLRSTQYYGDFQDYMRKILENSLRKHNYGMETPRDDDEALLVESLLQYECEAESPRCIAWAQDLFRAWMRQPDHQHNTIPSYLRGLVYSMALQYGGRGEFDFLWRVFLNSSDPAVKTTTILSMTSTRDDTLIRLLLERSLTVMPVQYANYVWGYSTPLGASVAQEVLMQQWQRIHDKFSKMDSFVLGGIIVNAFGYISSARHLETFKSFAEEHSEELKPHWQSILKLVDSATVRVNWVRAHTNETGAWLQQFNRQHPGNDTLQDNERSSSDSETDIRATGNKQESAINVGTVGIMSNATKIELNNETNGTQLAENAAPTNELNGTTLPTATSIDSQQFDLPKKTDVVLTNESKTTQLANNETANIESPKVKVTNESNDWLSSESKGTQLSNNTTATTDIQSQPSIKR